MDFLELYDYIIVKEIDEDWCLVKNRNKKYKVISWYCKRCKDCLCGEHKRPKKVLELKRFYNIVAGNDEYINMSPEDMN